MRRRLWISLLCVVVSASPGPWASVVYSTGQTRTHGPSVFEAAAFSPRPLQSRGIIGRRLSHALLLTPLIVIAWGSRLLPRSEIPMETIDVARASRATYPERFDFTDFQPAAVGAERSLPPSLQPTPEAVASFVAKVAPLIHRFTYGYYGDDFPRTCSASSRLGTHLLRLQFGDSLRIRSVSGWRFGFSHEWLEVELGGASYFLSFTEGQFTYWQNGVLRQMHRQMHRQQDDRFLEAYLKGGFGRVCFQPIVSEAFYPRYSFELQTRKEASVTAEGFDGDWAQWIFDKAQSTAASSDSPVSLDELAPNLRSGAALIRLWMAYPDPRRLADLRVAHTWAALLGRDALPGLKRILREKSWSGYEKRFAHAVMASLNTLDAAQSLGLVRAIQSVLLLGRLNFFTPLVAALNHAHRRNRDETAREIVARALRVIHGDFTYGYLEEARALSRSGLSFSSRRFLRRGEWLQWLSIVLEILPQIRGVVSPSLNVDQLREVTASLKDFMRSDWPIERLSLAQWLPSRTWNGPFSRAVTTRVIGTPMLFTHPGLVQLAIESLLETAGDRPVDITARDIQMGEGAFVQITLRWQGPWVRRPSFLDPFEFLVVNKLGGTLKWKRIKRAGNEEIIEHQLLFPAFSPTKSSSPSPAPSSRPAISLKAAA